MNKKSLFAVVLAALLLAACGGKSQETAPAAQPAPAEQEPAVAAEVPAAEEPVEAPVKVSGTMDYTSPEDIFKLEIPAGWDYEKDDDSIEDAVIETYSAPDGNAFVQTLVNKTSVDTSALLKGEYTVDYMRRLYGSDLKIAKDVLMDDGREKLTWWSDKNKTSGTTYFDMQDNYLFFFTTASKDKYASDYEDILADVADSFEY
jgi:hypothetical protein